MPSVCLLGNCLVYHSTTPTHLYTLSLHDALPIFGVYICTVAYEQACLDQPVQHDRDSLIFSLIRVLDRKSTRLNSSHSQFSYAVSCLKKKRDFSRCLRLRTC